MICLNEEAEDDDVAKMCQVETTAFIAWNKFGKKGGKAGSKGKKGQRGRPKFSAGMKPKLSLDERKKALSSLTAERWVTGQATVRARSPRNTHDLQSQA